MADVTVWTTIAASVGAVGAALVASWRLWTQRLNPFFAAVSKAMTVINGREAIILPEDAEVELSPAIPGALERLNSIEQAQGSFIMHLGRLQVIAQEQSNATEHLIAKVHEIEYEMKPNGGGSIKDSVNCMKASLAELQARLEDGDQRFDKIEEALTIIAEANRDLWPAIEAVARAEPPKGESQ